MLEMIWPHIHLISANASRDSSSMTARSSMAAGGEDPVPPSSVQRIVGASSFGNTFALPSESCLLGSTAGNPYGNTPGSAVPHISPSDLSAGKVGAVSGSGAGWGGASAASTGSAGSDSDSDDEVAV